MDTPAVRAGRISVGVRMSNAAEKFPSFALGVRSPKQNAALNLPMPRHLARHDSCRLLVADRLTQGGHAMTTPNDTGAHTQLENQGGADREQARRRVCCSTEL